MAISGMERFETVLNFTIGNLRIGTDQLTEEQQVNAKAEILQAVDRLLEDSALDLNAATARAFCGVLLAIYQTGEVPGNSSEPLVNQLAAILAEAGKAKRADSATEDPHKA